MNNQKLMRQTPLRPLAMPVLEQERAIMAVGEARGWHFQLLGVAPMVTKPTLYKNWLLLPADQDDGQMPIRAFERVRAIYGAGMRPQGFVIAHEVPPPLPKPASAPQVPSVEVWSKKLAEQSTTGLKRAGELAKVVIPVALAVSAAAAVIPLLGMLALGAVALDPCLIVVTEDHVWIQIDYWMPPGG